METSKKIIRAKVQLQNENPFFAYLIMNLKLHEKDDISTIGVDNFGNCYYNPKFIDTLTEEELKGVFAHEVLHLVLEHLSRGEKLNPQLFNISADLCVNDLLKENGFSLARGGLISDYDHSFTFRKSNGEEIEITDINKKTAEQIYAELYDELDKDKDATNGIDSQRNDEHIFSDKDENGKAFTEEEIKEFQNKWKQAVSEASAYARQKGNLSGGLTLLIDGLLNQKVNWKSLLYKYLTKTIPHDYSYARPSKRSFSTGVFMPIMKRENIEIVVSLDTSASIGKEELKEFLTEITGIAKSFNNLTMKLIICDYEIHEVYHIGNGDSEAIENLIIKGGGGTSHKPVYDYVKNELPNTRLLVNFTDGYTNFDELDDSINSLWVICKHGVSEDYVKFGEVIKLD